jgi:hypothetical protein
MIATCARPRVSSMLLVRYAISGTPASVRVRAVVGVPSMSTPPIVAFRSRTART